MFFQVSPHWPVWREIHSEHAVVAVKIRTVTCPRRNTENSSSRMKAWIFLKEKWSPCGRFWRLENVYGVTDVAFSTSSMNNYWKKSENKTHCIIPLSFFLRICNFLVHGSKGITIMLKKEKKTIFLFCFWNWMCSSWAFATLLRFYLSYYFRSYHANVTAVKGVAKSSGGLSTGTATCLQTQNKGVACFLLY